jgi:hypothetical protein
MGKKYSYTKHEQSILPEYRQKINRAESSEEVKKFFRYTVAELCSSIFENNMLLDNDDITLSSQQKPFFTVSDRLRSVEEFSAVWENSDLPNVIGRLAKPAVNRSRHLQKHLEKTTSKIRMS